MGNTTTRSSKLETPWEDIIRPAAGSENLKRRVAALAEYLRKKNADALGFLPKQTYRDAIDRDRMVATTENDSLCGILMWGRRRDRIKIHQTVIAEDSRRLLHATHAVEAVLEHPDSRGATILQLRVAMDLPALKFWTAIGMRQIYTVRGKLWKGRRIAVMQMKIAQTRARKNKLVEKLIKLAIERGSL